MAREFFSMSEAEKMKLAKKTFRKENSNTYRGYFPIQPDSALDNLKEGFEMGPSETPMFPSLLADTKFNLAEPNVWPSTSTFPSRPRAEHLYKELQSLSSTLLSLLATALGKPADFFASYLVDSLSTLRFLHYPRQVDQPTSSAVDGEPQLRCTPHTDSGILTLLHQDSTGGLEILNSADEWISAPCVPGSIVVNIGDLMAKVSGGRFVATMHRVRTSDGSKSGNGPGMGRFSVPFFFEPGESCVIKAVDDPEGQGVVYGEHIRKNMGNWVEYQDVEVLSEVEGMHGPMVEAY